MPGYREITVAGEGRRPRGGAAPARPRAAAGGWRSALAGGLAGAAALLRHSPGTAFGGLVALGAAGFVCFNALGHQAGRHPAPILPKVAAAAPAARPAAPVEAAAKDAPREAPRPEKAAAAKPAGRDAIGELIRSDETTASVTPRAEPRAAKAAAPEAPVVQAQRALAKLGYGPIKPDGVMGPGTKAAIESFERKSRLPVTGQAAGKTLRALLSRAAQG